MPKLKVKIEIEKVKIAKFIDSPDLHELYQALSEWQLAELPEGLKTRTCHSKRADFWKISYCLRSMIASQRQPVIKNRLIISTVDWIYTLIRLNVKRGRVFDLHEVLKTGKADCLGYCKLFTVLGGQCGLDTGVVDVIVDNRGVAMPHSAILVRLVNRKPRMVDFWFGTQNVHHRRLGLRVKRNNRWKVVDIESKLLKNVDYTYLPDISLDGITLYIEGNRSLKNGEYSKAVEQYSHAIQLYPVNARVFYNRAIAYEKLGEMEKAKRDFARALKGEAAIKRTLAVQPPEVVDLIQLDEQYIPEEQQQMYLLFAGFITGKRVSTRVVAKKAGISIAEASSILDSICHKLKQD